MLLWKVPRVFDGSLNSYLGKLNPFLGVVSWISVGRSFKYWRKLRGPSKETEIAVGSYCSFSSNVRDFLAKFHRPLGESTVYLRNSEENFRNLQRKVQKNSVYNSVNLWWGVTWEYPWASLENSKNLRNLSWTHVTSSQRTWEKSCELLTLERSKMLSEHRNSLPNFREIHKCSVDFREIHWASVQRNSSLLGEL